MFKLTRQPSWMIRTPFTELTAAGFVLAEIGDARRRATSRGPVRPVALVSPEGRCLTVDVDVATGRTSGHFTIDHDPRSTHLLIAETPAAAIAVARAAPGTPITVLTTIPDVSTYRSPI